MKKEKLFLIDGHSIVNRAFYGIPLLTNSQGLHTNAVYGFLNIFLNAYKEFDPDYIIVAFDVRKKTFRHELYGEYKGNRKAMPDELHEQVPVLMDILHAMGVHTAQLPGYEADDVIGTYAKKAEKEGLDVVILSGDRDLLQLAADTTMVAIPKTKSGGTEVEKYFAADVVSKYGVTPSEFIEMKALMGDASDNIPGIPGIGEKTASAIIGKWKSLENAYSHVEEVTPNRARENLKTYIEQGRMSLVLATINPDSPVETDFHECKVESEGSFYNKEAYQLLKELELNRLLARFDIDSFEDKPARIEYSVNGISQFPKMLEKCAGIFVDPERRLCALSTEEETCVYTGFPEYLPDLLNDGSDIYCFGLKDLLHTINAQDLRSDNIYDLEIMAYLLNPLNILERSFLQKQIFLVRKV